MQQFKKILFLICLLFLSCENPVGVEANLDQEFKLRAGERAVILGENFKIRFLSVREDSRCPIDARCFWAGNAMVILQLEKENSERVDTVNTYLDPKFSRFSQYYIALKNLEPYRRINKEILPNQYVATLEVTRIR